jgi:hypothetical protein
LGIYDRTNLTCCYPSVENVGKSIAVKYIKLNLCFMSKENKKYKDVCSGVCL